MKRHFRPLFLLLSTVFVSLALAETARDANGCPMDLPNTSEMAHFEGSCYQFVPLEKFWHQARDYCLERRGRLVKINDPQTNEFIVERLRSLHWQNSGVWIGLHDIDSELNWKWTGFQLHESDPVLWTNWGRGHPRAFLHRLRDCVRMVREDNWKWHETFCNSMRWHYRFICEYNAVVVGRSGQSSENRQQHSIETANMMQHLDSESLAGESRLQAAAAAAVAVKAEDEVATSGDGTHKSATIPIAIACLLVGALALVALFVVYRRRRRQSEEIREYSDENYVGSKGKEFDDVMTEATSPFRPSAVSNLYVDADAKGHVTSRLTAMTEDHLSEAGIDASGCGKLGRAKDAVIKARSGGLVEGRYNTPGDMNVYSEILDEYGAVAENGHIYEAIENVKK